MVRKVFTWISVILMIIGSLNWMLIGIFDFNLVSFITFGSAVASSIVYIVVGCAALWMIIYLATIPFVNEEASTSISGRSSNDKREAYGKYNRVQSSERMNRQRNRSQDNFNRYRNY